jgi:alkaline phosphatase
MAEQLVNSDDRATLASALLGFELSKAESSKLSKAKGEKDLYSALRHILNERSRTGWTTRGHTGVDVQVFAMGKGAVEFFGYSDNTDLAKKVFSLLD